MIDIKQNVPLSSYSSLAVGGPASSLVVVNNKEELLEALVYAEKEKEPVVVIGGGSNILVSDKGYSGIVIINKANKYERKADIVFAESGASLNRVASSSLDDGFLGFEFGIGIPGTIGGAVAGNVGTRMGDISGILLSAEVWHKGAVSIMDGENLEYDYRYSNIKGKEGYIVLSARFRLQEGDTTVAKSLVKDEIKRRLSSYRGLTAGSYFKNPKGDKAAAELIEAAGLKGFRIGGAEVSTDHANVFRNAGGAKASDFYELEKTVISKVKELFDIHLEPEVIKIGDF